MLWWLCWLWFLWSLRWQFRMTHIQDTWYTINDDDIWWPSMMIYDIWYMMIYVLCFIICLWYDMICLILIYDDHDDISHDDDIYCWTCLIFMLMLMLDLWYMIHDTWYMTQDTHDTWYMIHDIYCWTCLIFMLMLMLDLWLQAETPGVTHFGAYHRPPDGQSISVYCPDIQAWIQRLTRDANSRWPGTIIHIYTHSSTIKIFAIYRDGKLYCFTAALGFPRCPPSAFNILSHSSRTILGEG